MWSPDPETGVALRRARRFSRAWSRLARGVLVGEDGADAGFAFRDCREGDAGGHDAFVEEGAGDGDGRRGLRHH